MARCELLFKVNDSPGSGKWRDGAVIDAKPPGIYISPVEIEAFLATSALPAAWDTLSGLQKKLVRIALRQMMWWPGKTLADARQVVPDMTQEDFDRRAAGEAHRRQQARTLGLDTNWGWRDLMGHGVVVADLELVEIDMARGELFDDTLHPLRDGRVALRTLRVPYELLAPPARVARWRDPADFVPVARNAQPVTFAQLQVI